PRPAGPAGRPGGRERTGGASARRSRQRLHPRADRKLARLRARDHGRFAALGWVRGHRQAKDRANPAGGVARPRRAGTWRTYTMADTSAGASDESQGSGPMIVQLQTLRALARKGLLTHEDVGQIVHDSEQMLAEPDRSRFRELAATIAPTAAAEDEPETPASTK